MTFKVSLRGSAERDLSEARTWYDERQPGLGEEFLSTLDALFDRLTTMPFAYPVVHSDVRRAVLSRFPYLVYFRIDANRVVVLACLHARRDPRLHRARTAR